MGVMRDAASNKSKLGARWQLNAAMLSRPADLSALVTLSQSKPKEFFGDDTLHILVGKLLNCQNEQVSDKDTKLDVLAILANLSGAGDSHAKEEVRIALQGVSEWFDDYLSGEQGDGLDQEPELHKSMLLLLARAWNYKLKTEDLLELTRGDRGLALDSVVGVLEDGRTYATELVQSRKPGEGYVAQWEHELVCRQHEKPLVLQLCRLVRGFTHPASYFAGEGESCSNARGDRVGGGRGDGEDLALFSVEEFSAEMDSLLEITLRSRVIEKLSVALHGCLFASHDERQQHPETTTQDVFVVEGNNWERREPYGPEASGGYEECRAPLEDSDHLAVHCVHLFTQNLYHYATLNTDFYRQHMLSDTLLVPRLILPYLDQCVRQARLLCDRRVPATTNQLVEGWIDNNSSDRSERTQTEDGEEQEALPRAEAALAQGIASSLRTLVIASFRAPPNKFVLGLMQRLNPTGSLLRARPFVARNDYIFTLLCLLNVNMGALNSSAMLHRDGLVDCSGADENKSGERSLDMVLAQGLLDDMAGVFQEMTSEAKRRVVLRVTQSGALPVSRDAPGYAAVLRVLGVADTCDVGGLDGPILDANGGAARAESKSNQEGEDWVSDRKTAKIEAEARVRKFSRGSLDAGTDTQAAAEPRSPTRKSTGSHRSPELRRSNRARNESKQTSTSTTASTTKRDEKPSDKRNILKRGNSLWVRPPEAGVKREERLERNAEDEGGAKGAVGEAFKLLGDLPSLGKKTSPTALADLKQQRVRVDLDLPSSAKSLSARLKASRGGGSHADGARKAGPTEKAGGDASNERRGGAEEGDTEDARDLRPGRKGDGEDRNGVDGVPKEFLCSINGHMMKQPARSPQGHAFEFSTILLWLESRGQVCPFTGKPLRNEDLVPDEELRTRIMRWHIQKTSIHAGRGTLEGDDIYDF